MQHTVLIMVDSDHVPDNNAARPQATLFAPKLFSGTVGVFYLSIFCDLSTTAAKLASHAEDNIYGSREHCNNKAIILSSFPYLCVDLPSSGRKGIRKIYYLHSLAISNNHKQS